MRKHYLFFIFLNIFSFYCFASDVTSPDEWFNKIPTANDIDTKLSFLNKAIFAADYKKWDKYPICMFYRSLLYKQRESTEASIKDLFFIEKKFDEYYEPWIENIFIYLTKNDYDKAYKQVNKALKCANKSLIYSNDQSVSDIAPIVLRYVLLQLKILIEFFEGMKKEIPKSKLALEQFYDSIKVLNINNIFLKNLILDIDFLNALIFFQQGDLVSSKQSTFASLDKNWYLENTPLIALTLNKNKDFKVVYLQFKEEFSIKKWAKPWAEDRKSWQLDQWNEIYNNYLLFPVTQDKLL